MKTMRDELLEELTKLSVLFPSMRFGQVVEMVATLAGALTVADLEKTTDVQLYQEAREFVARRLQQVDTNASAEESLSSDRAQLIQLLRQSSFVEDRPLMGAIIEIARAANSTSYDIEDEAMVRRLDPQRVVA
jgi:hypothetical protein